MKEAFLSIGSNLGNRADNIKKALVELERYGCRVLQVSPVYESEPWGFVSEHWFLNIVVKCKTHYSPFELLEIIETIERNLGRVDKSVNGHYKSRPIDIDILFYENYVISTPKLKIPHPRLHERLFVLMPMRDICPTFIHPLLNETIEELLDYCEDQSEIRLYSENLMQIVK